MGAAVTFVITLSTIVAWLLQYYVLNPLDLGFLQTIVFILVIAFLVQMLEIVMKKIAPALYKSLGVFLPLITTNCAVLGVAILVIQRVSILWSPLPTALRLLLALHWLCGFLLG